MNFTNNISSGSYVISYDILQYIEMTYLSAFVAIGLPLNLYVFVKLQANIKNSPTPFNLLKLHLNISDSLVLCIYAVSEVAWLGSYWWHAGSIGCKLVKFGQVFPFYLSSYVILSIAGNRLIVVLRVRRIVVNCIYVKLSLVASWVLSTVCSIPQFAFWDEFTLSPKLSQCTTVWLITRATQCRDRSIRACPEFYVRLPGEIWYNVFHIVGVFWLPAILVLMSSLVMRLALLRRVAKETHRRGTSTYSGTQNSLDHDTPTKKTSFPSYGASARRRKAAKLLQLPKSSDQEEGNKLSHWAYTVKSNVTRQTISLIMAYIACWLPYNIIAFWELIDPERFTGLAGKLDWLAGLILLNSVINPFLYNFDQLIHCKRKKRASF